MLPAHKLNDLSILFSFNQDLDSTLKTNYESKLISKSKAVSRASDMQQSID